MSAPEHRAPGRAAPDDIASCDVRIDRREFLGSAVAMAGGIAASASFVWPTAVPATVATRNLALAEWTIDDMWGVYPRYAEPIGYGRAGTEHVASAGSIDSLFHV